MLRQRRSATRRAARRKIRRLFSKHRRQRKTPAKVMRLNRLIRRRPCIQYLVVRIRVVRRPDVLLRQRLVPCSSSGTPDCRPDPAAKSCSATTPASVAILCLLIARTQQHHYPNQFRNHSHPLTPPSVVVKSSHLAQLAALTRTVRLLLRFAEVMGTQRRAIHLIVACHIGRPPDACLHQLSGPVVSRHLHRHDQRSRGLRRNCDIVDVATQRSCFHSPQYL